MKTQLPPELSVWIRKVEDVADGLAATSCDFPASSFDGMNVTCVLDNLDDVASAVCLEDLTDAPAKLMSAARAFRHVFPSDSIGWSEAATLNNAAVLIAEHLPKTFAAWPHAFNGSCEPSLTDSELAALEKADPQAFQEFNHKQENPFSNL